MCPVSAIASYYKSGCYNILSAIITKNPTQHTENCLDRHVAENPGKTAIIWEMNGQEHKTISYR